MWFIRKRHAGQSSPHAPREDSRAAQTPSTKDASNVNVDIRPGCPHAEREGYYSRRRGVAIVLVLGLLSLTLALSYALLRSQTIAAQVQQNSQRTVSARLAAQTGLSVALRKMQEANW